MSYHPGPRPTGSHRNSRSNDSPGSPSPPREPTDAPASSPPPQQALPGLPASLHLAEEMGALLGGSEVLLRRLPAEGDGGEPAESQVTAAAATRRSASINPLFSSPRSRLSSLGRRPSGRRRRCGWLATGSYANREHVIQRGDRFALFESIGQHAQRENLDPGNRFVTRRSVAHHARKFHDLGQPPTVGFLFHFDGHRLLLVTWGSPLSPRPTEWLPIGWLVREDRAGTPTGHSNLWKYSRHGRSHHGSEMTLTQFVTRMLDGPRSAFHEAALTVSAGFSIHGWPRINCRISHGRGQPIQDAIHPLRPGVIGCTPSGRTRRSALPRRWLWSLAVVGCWLGAHWSATPGSPTPTGVTEISRGSSEATPPVNRPQTRPAPRRGA